MNDQQHPLTPPPELVEQWGHNANLSGVPYDDETGHWAYEQHIAILAAQWGADQELEACCKYMQHEDFHGFAAELRAARRPKPPSLKEQALAILASVAVCELHGDAAPDNRLSTKDIDTIRRALEALSDD